MIPFADSKGPDQTARMPEDTFLRGAGHLIHHENTPI